MSALFSKMPFIETEKIIIKKIELKDANDLESLSKNETVYKYLPTFLPERQYIDKEYFITHICDELFLSKKTVLLGIYYKEVQNGFCGIAEIYHYDEQEKTVTIGYRLDEKFWGFGIATKVVAAITEYLFEQTDVMRIFASNMIDNPASGKVLEKNGYEIVTSGMYEDWGFCAPTAVDRW